MEALNQKLAQIKEEIEILMKQEEIHEAEKQLQKQKEKIEKRKADEEKKEKKYSSEENKQTVSLMKGFAIRHCYMSSIWTGFCDGNYFIINNNYYLSPSGLGTAHIKAVNNTRKNYNCNGWNDCEVYYLDKWIKMNEFRRRAVLV